MLSTCLRANSFIATSVGWLLALIAASTMFSFLFILSTIKSTALSNVCLSGLYNGFVNVANDALMYCLKLEFKKSFNPAPSGNMSAKSLFISINVLFNASALSCSGSGKSVFLI